MKFSYVKYIFYDICFENIPFVDFFRNPFPHFHFTSQQKMFIYFLGSAIIMYRGSFPYIYIYNVYMLRDDVFFSLAVSGLLCNAYM